MSARRTNENNKGQRSVEISIVTFPGSKGADPDRRKVGLVVDQSLAKNFDRDQSNSVVAEGSVGSTFRHTVQTTEGVHQLSIGIAEPVQPWQVVVLAEGQLLARGEITPESNILVANFSSFELEASLTRDAHRNWSFPIEVEIAAEWGDIEEQSGSILKGNGYLNQSGSRIEGMLVFDHSVLVADGELVREPDGRTHLALSAKGTILEQRVALGLTGHVAGRGVSGGLIGSWLGSNTVFAGPFRFPDIMFQEQDGPVAPQAEDPCGDLVWTSPVITGRLSDQSWVHYKIYKYERCIRLEFCDAHGNRLRRTNLITLSEDLNHRVGPPPGPGATDERPQILAYDAENNGEKIGEREGQAVKRVGEFKIIIVEGCSSVKIYQYVLHRRVKRLNRVIIGKSRWTGSRDPADDPWPQYPSYGIPPPGSSIAGNGDNDDDTETPTSGTGMTDFPGQPTDYVLPDDLLNPDADLVGPDDTYTVTDEKRFYSFICCDDEYLGYVTWGYDITYTIANGRQSVPVVSKHAPQFNQPGGSRTARMLEPQFKCD